MSMTVTQKSVPQTRKFIICNAVAKPWGARKPFSFLLGSFASIPIFTVTVGMSRTSRLWFLLNSFPLHLQFSQVTRAFIYRISYSGKPKTYALLNVSFLTLWSRTQNYSLSRAEQLYCSRSFFSFSPRRNIWFSTLLVSDDSQGSALSSFISHIRFLQS